MQLHPQPPCRALDAALRLAQAEAKGRMEFPMLLSWYDRDRDFESPQHASECHAAGAVPGYVDYALHRGASLKVDVEDGRFVFYYLNAGL
ncbi:MAG TPA: AF1514 family protein [Burkholderiales bacterium]|nr:AF1514 family protein [Burkholderiales bacterium]